MKKSASSSPLRTLRLIPLAFGLAAASLLSACYTPASNVDELADHYNRGNITPIPDSPVLWADTIRESGGYGGHHQPYSYHRRFPRHGYGY